LDAKPISTVAMMDHSLTNLFFSGSTNNALEKFKHIHQLQADISYPFLPTQ